MDPWADQWEVLCKVAMEEEWVAHPWEEATGAATQDGVATQAGEDQAIDLIISAKHIF